MLYHVLQLVSCAVVIGLGLVLIAALDPGTQVEAIHAELVEHPVLAALIEIVLYIENQRRVVAVRVIQLLVRCGALMVPEPVVR